MPTLAKFQIGKNGLTEGVLNSLELALKNHRQVRISVLKSATRSSLELRALAELIKEKLRTKCNVSIIGYTIILIKKGKR